MGNFRQGWSADGICPIVEPVFADMKENKGMRGFLTGRIKAARGEFQIICAAVNIKRIWARMKNKKG